MKQSLEEILWAKYLVGLRRCNVDHVSVEAIGEEIGTGHVVCVRSERCRKSVVSCKYLDDCKLAI